MEHCIDSLIGDLWSIHLAIMGIMVSVLTLLYATLSGLCEELRGIADTEDYLLMNRKTALCNSIKVLRRLDKKTAQILAISAVLFLLISLLKYAPTDSILLCCVIGVITIITICEIGRIVFLANDIYKQYQK